MNDASLKLANKIPVLLMFPVAAVAVYFIGANVTDTGAQVVDGSRRWLLVFLGIYAGNYAVAWFMRNSWPAAMIRMLACGLFAYIAISELVDVLGGAWGHWHQLLGGEGTLPEKNVSALRYTTTAWTVGLTMMAVCIALGFESGETTDSQ